MIIEFVLAALGTLSGVLAVAQAVLTWRVWRNNRLRPQLYFTLSLLERRA